MKQFLQQARQYPLLVLLLLTMNVGWGQVNINPSSPYSQDFNTLTTAGTWTNNSTLSGWYVRTTATASITSFALNTGTLNGGFYSFGSTGNNDRAIGFGTTNTFTGTAGSGLNLMGLRLKNNSGATIGKIIVKYDGEQWRRDNTVVQSINVSYKIENTATDLISGTWTSVPDLKFDSPNIVGTASALDGNNSANRQAEITAEINVTILDGQEILIRWEDLNDSGNDHHLAIDNVNITVTTLPTNVAPLASSVNITGTLHIGQTLTGGYTYSDADNDLEGTSTYQWFRADDASGLNTAAISGATNATYTLTAADNGKHVRFGVTPVAATGTSPGTQAFSSWQLVNSFPVATNVAVTGVYTEGQILEASYDYTDADNDSQGTSLYQWLEADDNVGTNEVAISGATNSTYELTSADIGKYIRVRVTPVATTGSNPGEEVFSAYGGPVTDASTPTISVTQTLEAFEATCVNQNSAVQSYTISALSLIGDLTISAPTHFQIKTGAGAWGSEIVLSPSSGTIAETTIEVRFAPTANGAQSGDITHVSAGATTQNFTVTGTAINTLPTVDTPTSTSIGTTTVTLGGNLTNEGCQDVTNRGVEYSTTNNFTTGTGTQVADSGSFDIGTFTVNVTGLTAGTTYYYRAFATSSAGTTYSDQASFATLSTNANLSNLVLSAGTLVPTFDANTTTYEASVSGATATITVTPTVQVAGATLQVRVNGGSYVGVTSGVASGALALNVGNNTIEVLVTAQDGTTTKLYTVTVSRPEPPVLIAGWDFQTTTNGGTLILAAPNTPKVFLSNFGNGTLYLDGTNNSSDFIAVTTGNELTAFAGTAVNTTSGDGFSTTTTAGALAVVGGTNNSANGKSAVFVTNMLFYKNLEISYATQRTASGFTSQTWEYSLDGNSWTPISIVSSIPSSFGLISLPVINGVDGNSLVYVRLTFNGSTSTSQNNRLDNIKFQAQPDFITWDGNNWSNITGPTSSINTVVQGNLSLSSNISVKNLNLSSGTLNLNGFTLTVNGSIVKTSGIINGTNGKIIFTNPSNASIPANTFVDNTLEDLELNTSQQVALNGVLKVSGVFTPSQGTLVSNGNLILGSNATGTARVAPVGVGASITGNVSVERYIPAKRAWRFLTAPVTGNTNNSVYFNWQNNGAAGNNGTGVNLWSPAGGNGLVAGGGSPNIYKYKTVAPAGWDAITNTQTEALFTNTTNNAFMVFVTGGANTTNIASGATATTMVTTGALRTGNINYGNLPSNIHTLIGNPYASPISPLAVLNGNPGFRDKLWVLDPQLGSVGQYVIYDKVAGYTNLFGSYQAGTNIQSGQAFFVRRSSLSENTAATFTITEAHKATVSDNGVFDRNATQSITIDKLRLSLWKNQSEQAQNLDAVLAVFYDNGNNAVDMADGGKINGVGENLALMNGTSAFTLEHRATAIPQDVLPVRVSGMQEGANYQLRVQTEGFNNPNVEVFLHDTFTNTVTPIPTDDTVVTYPFAVTSATASTGNRFQVVFQNSPLGVSNPDGFTQAVVYPNPVNDGMLHIALPTATYQKVSLYNALGQVVYQQNALGTTNLLQVSTQGLANGYYQLQVEDQQGQKYQAKVIINQ